jgi:3'(2'), 5'-bisphosphate nucleotidase
MIHQDMMLRSAVDAVAKAAHVARGVQRRLESVRQMTKDDRSPVTVADYALQALVAMELGAAAGGSGVRIVGEERAEMLRRPENGAIRGAVLDAVRSARPDATEGEMLDAIDAGDHDGTADAFWTLDPIDGTKGFLRGQQYAIALARIEHGRVTMAVMGCPNLAMDLSASLDEPDPRGVVYIAAAGWGAWEQPADGPQEQARRLRLLPRDPREPVRLCESIESAHTSQGDSRRVMEEIGAATRPVRIDSQCKYALVGRGQADAYLRLPTGKGYVEKIWDHAAGMLIAAEAGAGVSDINGAPLDFSRGRRLERNRGIVCAARDLHGPILGAIRTLGLDRPAAAAVGPARVVGGGTGLA